MTIRHHDYQPSGRSQFRGRGRAARTGAEVELRDGRVRSVSDHSPKLRLAGVIWATVCVAVVVVVVGFVGIALLPGFAGY